MGPRMVPRPDRMSESVVPYFPCGECDFEVYRSLSLSSSGSCPACGSELSCATRSVGDVGEWLAAVLARSVWRRDRCLASPREESGGIGETGG